MFDNFSLMRTQKINDIDELLKIYDEDSLLVQKKLPGTLGIFYKTDGKTCFKTRIGINFKNIQNMSEDIPDNTAYLSIISHDNDITVIDILFYDEKTIYTKPLHERIEYINKHKEILDIQEFKSVNDVDDLQGFIIKPKGSSIKQCLEGLAQCPINLLLFLLLCLVGLVFRLRGSFQGLMVFVI